MEMVSKLKELLSNFICEYLRHLRTNLFVLFQRMVTKSLWLNNAWIIVSRAR